MKSSCLFNSTGLKAHEDSQCATCAPGLELYRYCNEMAGIWDVSPDIEVVCKKAPVSMVLQQMNAPVLSS